MGELRHWEETQAQDHLVRKAGAGMWILFSKTAPNDSAILVYHFWEIFWDYSQGTEFKVPSSLPPGFLTKALLERHLAVCLSALLLDWQQLKHRSKAELLRKHWWNWLLLHSGSFSAWHPSFSYPLPSSSLHAGSAHGSAYPHPVSRDRHPCGHIQHQPWVPLSPLLLGRALPLGLQHSAHDWSFCLW